MLRRRPAQLQLVQFELRPLTLALEAPLLLRLGRLASTAVGAHMHSAAELEGPARAAVAAVAARLAGALEEPPTCAAGGRVLYCETLRISEVEVEVSSTLDPHEEESATMLSSAPGWVAACYRLPLLRNLLQSLLVLVKGIGMNLANVSAAPFHFDGVLLHHPFCTPAELAYQLGQQASWQAAAQLGKLLGRSNMLGNPIGLVHSVGGGVAGQTWA